MINSDCLGVDLFRIRGKKKKKKVAVYKTDVAEQTIQPGRALPVPGHL